MKTLIKNSNILVKKRKKDIIKAINTGQNDNDEYIPFVDGNAAKKMKDILLSEIQ